MSGVIREVAADPAAWRADFPILSRTFREKPLVYLDSAATTQKPQAVIDAVTRFYAWENANVHRGVYKLSEEASARFEAVRPQVARFIGAPGPRGVIFVRGATEGINLVASTWGRTHVGEGDEVLITGMEHHANLVPWQQLCLQSGARLVVAPLLDDGSLDLEAWQNLLGPKTRMAAMVHVSNALGTVNPVRDMVSAARAAGAVTLVDGSQAAPHMSVDISAIGCDFYVFSGHKVYGPTGIGVLWGREELLEEMPPYHLGGDMILSVTFEETVFNEIPHKFEAGTPHVEGVLGLSAAMTYLESLGLDRVRDHEDALLAYGTNLLQDVPGLRMVGTATHKAGVLGFVMDGVHPHDLGTLLDARGIAIRAGHHCAQPVMKRFGVPATARASLGLYNRREDLEALAEGLLAIRRMFG
ncbi:MAG: cysteine desulfurase [Candidatus Sericytochromatia bacterium]|nr:cysteine desulfurase [Candidatus Sericytochromatia bacterium]